MYSPVKFDELIAEFYARESLILGWKRGEYSTNTDRLQNFREVADFIGDKPIVITPSVVALIYLLKHIQSIKNATINSSVNWCWEGEFGEGTKQRLGDIRNYVLLLAACMDEEAEEGEL